MADNTFGTQMPPAPPGLPRPRLNRRPATVSGSKTVIVDVSPSLSASLLTSLFATAPENLTVGQLLQLVNATKCVVGGGKVTATLGSIFN
jgi:hypothetical protein